MVLVCFARARLHDEAPTPILLLLLTAQRRKTGMPWRAVHHAREKCQRAQPRLALQSRRRVVAERERRCRVLRAISKDRKPLRTEQARWMCFRNDESFYAMPGPGGSRPAAACRRRAARASPLELAARSLVREEPNR